MLSTGGAPGIRDGLTFAVASKGYRQDIKVPEDVSALMRDILRPLRRDADRSDGIVSVLTEKLRPTTTHRGRALHFQGCSQLVWNSIAGGSRHRFC